MITPDMEVVQLIADGFRYKPYIDKDFCDHWCKVKAFFRVVSKCSTKCLKDYKSP